MSLRIWHQSFTVIDNIPGYGEALKEHFAKVARPGTEVVLHGMHRNTYQTNYPGADIRYAYFQHLHAHQFAMGGVSAEEEGYDAYAIMTLPEPSLRETRSLIDIPVVGYGESSILMATQLGQRVGVLLFIKEMAPIIEENVETIGLRSRFAGAHYVGFGFNDVLHGYNDASELLDKFYDAARKLIVQGADVIIPGEVPLCLLLARHGINRVDDVPILDGMAATIKMAESMVDLRRSCGLSPSRRGYFMERPPRERVKELFELYGISRLKQNGRAD